MKDILGANSPSKIMELLSGHTTSVFYIIAGDSVSACRPVYFGVIIGSSNLDEGEAFTCEGHVKRFFPEKVLEEMGDRDVAIDEFMVLCGDIATFLKRTVVLAHKVNGNLFEHVYKPAPAK